jgi:hypothetical protein
VKTLSRLALALLIVAAGTARARADVQKKTLLSSDGTLYAVQTGLASELGLTDVGPNDYAVVWSSLAQDGTTAGGEIPHAANSNPKTSLDLTFDEPTGTLVVLWREESSILNLIKLAFARGGAWTLANLQPNIGFPHAYNPEMLLTHQTVHSLDAAGADVYTNRSVLSVIWWEEASVAQARYASVFLDETIDPSQIEVINLPDMVNAQGPTSLAGIPRGSYAFPALQSAGPGGGILASFSAVATGQQFVVRIDFPTDLGQPSVDPATWLRRRIPVVGVVSVGQISAVPAMDAASIGTAIGSSYRPTLYWSDGTALHYIRFDGTVWSDTRSITLGDGMTYDQAVALVWAMAQRN